MRAAPASDIAGKLDEPYTIDGTQYRPADGPSDEVGYAGFMANGIGVSATHKTLPVPSYVEVTSLATGRTILVRIAERGPATNYRLADLSLRRGAAIGPAGRRLRRRPNSPRQPAGTGADRPARRGHGGGAIADASALADRPSRQAAAIACGAGHRCPLRREATGPVVSRGDCGLAQITSCGGGLAGRIAPRRIATRFEAGEGRVGDAARPSGRELRYRGGRR